MSKQVDSYHFLDRLTTRAMKGWAEREPVRAIPWTPLSKPLSECRLALVSSAAIALKSDIPFDLELERRNPWISDPSYRVLPRDATEDDVTIYHLHIDRRFAQQDLNCIFPLQHLASLEAVGEIGYVAPRHYTFMGYTCEAAPLIANSLPGILRSLQEDQVDAVLLIPV